MSPRHARRHHREDRHLCADCRQRKAKYQYRGQVRADRQHVLCFQCFRAARERQRAQLLQVQPAQAALPFGSRSLTAAQIHHRERMLAYLQSLQVSECAR